MTFQDSRLTHFLSRWFLSEISDGVLRFLGFRDIHKVNLDKSVLTRRDAQLFAFLTGLLKLRNWQTYKNNLLT